MLTNVLRLILNIFFKRKSDHSLSGMQYLTRVHVSEVVAIQSFCTGIMRYEVLEFSLSSGELATIRADEAMVVFSTHRLFISNLFLPFMNTLSLHHHSHIEASVGNGVRVAVANI